MKVAYNACYGGFSLSTIALDLYAKKKGIKLYWYKRDNYKTDIYTKSGLEGIPNKDLFSVRAFTKDLGEYSKASIDDSFYYPCFHDDSSRTDKDLIEVIEELGEEASGSCAELEIEEIPDGVEFEIEEYDGLESVVPPRQTW